MKKLLFLFVMLIAGIAVGGGAGYAAVRLLGPAPTAAPAPVKAAPEANPHFVPAGHILAPLVGVDGSLSGYVQFDVQLEVAEDKSEFVTTRLPLLLNAINMRTYRTPMASGPDGMLPDLGAFRKVAEAAATEAFGAGVVRRVTITQATPV